MSGRGERATAVPHGIWNMHASALNMRRGPPVGAVERVWFVATCESVRDTSEKAILES